MSGKSIISNSYLEDIGDAIRYKKGTEETFYPSEMGDAIRSIEGIVPTGTMEIDANGVYDVTEKAEVDVDVQPDLRPLSVSENGEYQPDGFDGYDSVTVDVIVKRLIGEYVLSVDKLNISDHESYWLENYLPTEQDPTAIYIIEFEQNNAPNYAVKKIIVPGLIGGTFSVHNACIAYRYTNGVLIRYGISIDRNSDSSRTLNAAKGTVIKVYEAYNKISI